LNHIVFKWCSDEKIPEDLYHMTSELVGYSKLDNFAIYKMDFNCSIGVLKLLYEDNDLDIFQEVSKQLRVFKIQKIVHKLRGKKYVNKDLEKFSTFLQYYYQEKGNINIIEQINK
jgi:hypothetical protein